MKIAIVGFRFCCSTGKRNRQVWEEYAKLYKTEEIHIYTGKKYLWDKWKEDLDPNPFKNLKIHQIPIWFSKLGQFKYAFPTIIPELLKLKPDRVYVAEEPTQPFVTWLCALYCKFKKTPFYFFTYENQNKRWFFPVNHFEKLCLRIAKKIICASEKSAKILTQKFRLPSKKIHIFPETGIDLNVFKKTKPLRLRKKIILFTGRFIPEKGIKDIIKAKKRLDSQGEKYSWLFIGSGQMREYIQSEGGKNIKIYPWVQRKKLAEQYNKAKVFLYPSLQTESWEEQFGYSMVESLACGTPVITTPNAGALGIVKDKTSFVPFGNPKVLASKIRRFVKMKKEINCNADVRKRFSLNSIAKKWHSVFFN